MTSKPIDSLDLYRQHRDAGIDEKQAEAHADIMAKALIPAIQDMMDRQTQQLETMLDRKLALAKLQLGLLTLTAVAGAALIRYVTG